MCLAFAGPPTTWRSVGPGGGGSLFAPTFSPFNASELTLACDMSGQYHTTTLGTAWNLTPFTSLVVGGHASDVGYTSDPSRIYLLDAALDAQRPMVSTDGGTTYAPIANDPTQGDAWYLFADPTTTTRLFVSDYSNLYFSKDSGATWSTVVSGSSGAGVVVGGALFDGARIFVGTSLGVYVSIDGGQTFSKYNATGIPNTEAIVSFAAAKVGATTRFFAVTLPASGVYGGMQGDNCYSFQAAYSLDYSPSAKWVKRMVGLPSSAHFFFVKCALNDLNTVYLGGGDDSGAPSVYKSSNGAVSWSNALKTQNNANIITGWQGWGGDRGWGFDQLCFGLTVAANNSQHVAFTGMGFCHVSTNGGSLWRQTYVTPTTQNAANARIVPGKNYQGVGLENTSCWTLAWSDSQNIWAGFTDIDGVRSVDGGSQWNFNYSGDNYNSCYQTVKSPTGALYSAVSTTHDMYESTHLTDASIDSGSGAVLTSTDKGKTWKAVGNLNHVVVGVSLDPTNPKRLYASVANSASGGIYVCQDVTAGAAAAWSLLALPPRTEGHADSIFVLNDGSLVCSYSGRRASNFTKSSGVFYSTDHGLTWSDRSSPNMLYWTRDITIDPTDSTQKTWYAAVYSGWGGQANGLGGLYKTVDRGLHWTQVLNQDRVGSCTVNPRNGNEVYAATETQGLWYSSSAKGTSPTFSQLSAYPFRHPQRIFFNPTKAGEIWVTSFGNGLRVGTSTAG